jgi:hypothetical protein
MTVQLEALCAISPEQAASWSKVSFEYRLNTTVYRFYYENGTVLPDCGTPDEELHSPAGYPGILVW